jgi:hypothetical protein
MTLKPSVQSASRGSELGHAVIANPAADLSLIHRSTQAMPLPTRKLSALSKPQIRLAFV